MIYYVLKMNIESILDMDERRMKNILLLEDNEVTQNVLTDLIRNISSDVNIYSFLDMIGIYDFIMTHTIDLFLIDIIIDKNIIGDTSGLKFAEEIRKITRYEFVPIIFISSLYDPKLYAYSTLHSFEYIEKPFDKQHVIDTVTKALRFPNSNTDDISIHFRIDGAIFVVKCSELLYIESLRHRIYIYKSDGNNIIAPYKTFEKILLEAEGAGLQQISRSIIINVKYLECVDWVNNCIKLKGCSNLLNIGTTYKKRLRNIFDDI